MTRRERTSDPDTNSPAPQDSKIDQKTSKKVTISLALDDSVVAEIRKEADDSDQSLNSRINAILKKYVIWYRLIDLNKGVVVPQPTHQLIIDEIDEAKYTEEMKRIGADRVAEMIIKMGVPLTLDNIVKITFETFSLYGGAITGVTKYIDDNDGKTCLFFRHSFNEKWSRMLSAAYSQHLESLLHYHITRRIFSNGFELKILEKDPV